MQCRLSLLAIAAAASATGAKAVVSDRTRSNAAATVASWLAAESELLPPHALNRLRPLRADALLYPPFSVSPALTVVDSVSGSTFNFPIPGAPAVFLAYDATNTVCEAAWSNRNYASSVDQFLTQSLLPGVDAANATRYVFMSQNASAGGAAADAAMMHSVLTARMKSLNWNASVTNAWLSNAVFVATPVTGWVADLLSNWTNVGGSGGNAVLALAPSGVVIPRIDSRLGWLPPPPSSPLRLTVVTHTDAGSLMARDLAPCSGSAACAVAVGCGFALDHAAPHSRSSTCSFAGAVQAAQTAGASALILVAAPGETLVEPDCDASVAHECDIPLNIPVSLVRYADGVRLAREATPQSTIAHRAAASSGIAFAISAAGLLNEVSEVRSALNDCYRLLCLSTCIPYCGGLLVYFVRRFYILCGCGAAVCVEIMGMDFILVWNRHGHGFQFGVGKSWAWTSIWCALGSLSPPF